MCVWLLLATASTYQYSNPKKTKTNKVPKAEEITNIAHFRYHFSHVQIERTGRTGWRHPVAPAPFLLFYLLIVVCQEESATDANRPGVHGKPNGVVWGNCCPLTFSFQTSSTRHFVHKCYIQK